MDTPYAFVNMTNWIFHGIILAMKLKLALTLAVSAIIVASLGLFSGSPQTPVKQTESVVTATPLASPSASPDPTATATNTPVPSTKPQVHSISTITVKTSVASPSDTPAPSQTPAPSASPDPSKCSTNTTNGVQNTNCNVTSINPFSH